MKSLTVRLLKACFKDPLEDPMPVLLTGAACSIPIIPLTVLSTTLAIDAVGMPLGWLLKKSERKPDPIKDTLHRLAQAEQLSRQIPDPEEREAFLRGLSAQRRKLLLDQATGANLDSCGHSDQRHPNP